MVVADAEISLTITGNGDVLEPYDGVIGVNQTLGSVVTSITTEALYFRSHICNCHYPFLNLWSDFIHERTGLGEPTCKSDRLQDNPGIGSGGAYASAARALIDLPEFDAEAIG